ncbi:MAG: TIM barrel protein [Pseudomonadota bacterium]
MTKWPASIHLGYVLGDHAWGKRLDIALELGFSAVEFPFPQSLAPADYPKRLGASGLKHVNVGFPVGDGMDAYRKGAPGIAVNDEASALFDEELKKAVDYAAGLSAPYIHLFSGLGRSDQSATSAWGVLCENAAKTLETIRPLGMQLIIEPISSLSFPGYMIDTPAKAARLAKEIGATDVKLMLDVFHSLKMDINPVAIIDEYAPMLGHIQFADFPGRHEPSQGVLDFSKIFNALEAVHYQGLVGLEYIPTRDIRPCIPLRDYLSLSEANG